MGGERISLEAERTDPYSCADVDIAGSISRRAAAGIRERHTQKDSAQLCKAVCKRQVRTVVAACQVSPSRECKELRSVQRALRLPIRL